MKILGKVFTPGHFFLNYSFKEIATPNQKLIKFENACNVPDGYYLYYYKDYSQIYNPHQITRYKIAFLIYFKGTKYHSLNFNTADAVEIKKALSGGKTWLDGNFEDWDSNWTNIMGYFLEYTPGSKVYKILDEQFSPALDSRIF